MATDYVPVPPARMPGYVCEGGRNRTDYGGYRTGLNDVFKGLPHRIALYDVDLVLEVDSDFKAIFEWKEYQKTYEALYVPFFEYVALKKVAMKMQVPPYVIIHQGEKYHVLPVDRFEDPRRRDRRVWNGRQHAVFYPSEGLELNHAQFVEHMRLIATGAV